MHTQQTAGETRWLAAEKEGVPSGVHECACECVCL